MTCQWFADCRHPAVKVVKMTEVGPPDPKAEPRVWRIPACGTHAHSAERWGRPSAGRGQALDAMVES